MCEKKKKSFPISISSSYLADCFCLLLFFSILISGFCAPKKSLLPLTAQKLQLNGCKYSIFTSTVRMSIHILEFPHNKDFYLYKSNEMQKNFTTPTKVKQKQEKKKKPCTHNFTKAFLSVTDCITAVITISCTYMKPTVYCHILFSYQHKLL